MAAPAPDTVTTREIKYAHERLKTLAPLPEGAFANRLAEANEESTRKAWDFMAGNSERIASQGSLESTLDVLFKDEGRRNRARAQVDLLNRLLTQGYDNLQTAGGTPDAAGKQQLRDVIRAKVLNDAATAFTYKNLPTENDRRLYIESILRDPTYLSSVSTLLKNRVVLSPEDTSIKQAQKDAERDVDTARAELRRKQEEVDLNEDKQNRLKDTGTRLTDIRSRIGQINSRMNEIMDVLRGQNEVTTGEDPELERLSLAMNTEGLSPQMKSRLQTQYINRLMRGTGTAATTESGLRLLTTEYQRLDTELQLLNTQKYGYEDQHGELVAKRKVLEGELTDAKKKLEKAEDDLQEVKDRRVAFENDKIASLQNISPDAAVSALTAAHEASVVYEQKLMGEIENAQERQVMETVHQQIRNTKDVKYLLDQIKDRGFASLLEDETLLPGIEFDKRELILRDPERMARFQQQVVPMLFRRRFESGKKLTKKEFRDFVDSPYVGREVITKALADTEQFKQAERQAIESGAVSRGFMDQMQRLPKQKFLTIAMLILTGALTIGTGALIGHWLFGSGNIDWNGVENLPKNAWKKASKPF